jgi:hypothetical protein
MISQSQSEEWPLTAVWSFDHTGPFFFLYRNHMFKTLRFFACWLLISICIRAGLPPRPTSRIPLRRSPVALARCLVRLHSPFSRVPSHSPTPPFGCLRRPIYLRQIGCGVKSFDNKPLKPLKIETLALTSECESPDLRLSLRTPRPSVEPQILLPLARLLL